MENLEVKTENRLKNFFRTPEQTMEEQQIIFQRNQKHWDELQASFPESVKDCQLSMSEIGKDLIRAFIYCPNDISEEDTRTAMKWLTKFSGKIEKNFRSDAGTFYWVSRNERRDEHGKYDYMIFLEKTHPLNCEIVKVKKEVEVFESHCKE